jgi:hypothetical protein
MIEDRRVGLGHTDDVTVDDAAHLDVITRADLTDLADQHRLDLATRVRHDAEWHARLCQLVEGHSRLGDHPTPQPRGAGTSEHERRLGPVGLSDSDPIDVLVVVRLPRSLRLVRVRLRLHRGVVRAAMPIDISRPAVGREQRPEDHRIRQHQHAARVEQHGVESSHRWRRLSRAGRAGRP